MPFSLVTWVGWYSTARPRPGVMVPSWDSWIACCEGSTYGEALSRLAALAPKGSFQAVMRTKAHPADPPFNEVRSHFEDVPAAPKKSKALTGQAVLAILDSSPEPKQAQDLADILGLTIRRIEQVLAGLCKDGLIESTGSDRTGRKGRPKRRWKRIPKKTCESC
jgi:hypothetical protein